ncbi:MAG: AI-2E family transporter [Candidatus Hydrogenedentes bacterium]|nr:AI-2E family transporter [Candidatus Hydrogenedentota bacterium]
MGIWIRNNAANYLRAHKELLANAGKWAGASLADIMRTLGNTVVGVLLFLGQFVLFAVVTVYLLKDYDHIVASAHALVPPRYRVKTAEIAAKIDLQLKSFLRGQFLVCCCLGTMYCIGFFISGVPFALTLGLFGGAASFVPFLGLALTILPSVLLTLVDHGLDWHIVGVAATFGIAQFLEGNVLTPRIVGSQVGLGPVWVILAVMVFGTLFGFPGLLMAVPSAAILKVLVTEALEYYRKSPVFETAPPGGSGL